MEIKCRMCHALKPVSCTADQYLGWVSGELIQNAMPDVSPGERELLISQTCSDCFDAMFAPAALEADLGDSDDD